MIPDPDTKGFYSGAAHAARPVPYDTLVRVPEGAAMLTFDTCPRCGVAGTEACQCAGTAAAAPAGALAPTGVWRDPVEPWPHTSASVHEAWSAQAADWADEDAVGNTLAAAWDRLAPVAVCGTALSGRWVLRTRED